MTYSGRFWTKSLIFSLLASMLLASACIPPRCKIPNCEVVIDHNHAKHGKGGSKPRKASNEPVVYRGVAWYRYIFRKKYKAQTAKGRYRKIDTREAYDK